MLARVVLIGSAVAFTVAAFADDAVAVPPGSPPPVAGVLPAPPPAWIETIDGDHWLQTGFSRWCEGQRCVSLVPAQELAPGAPCGDVLARIPEIRVRPASQVVFHLGFDPTALRLTMAPGLGIPPIEGPGRTFPLTAGRDVAWTATGAGGVATLIPETAAGDVWYRARLAITTDTAEPSISGLRPVRRGADVALGFRASERVSVVACIAPATDHAARFRAVHASGLGPGPAVVRLGRLPVDRYLVTLVMRDSGGNGVRARIRFGPTPSRRAR